MINNGMRPIHPGEILREEFLVPIEMSANALAIELHVPAPRINDVIRERRSVRRFKQRIRSVFSLFLGFSHRYWFHEISERGQVKVADFGLARQVGSPQMTATGVLVGTASYLPPELVTHSRPDGRSDVYSAGVVLFELLTGKRAVGGDDVHEVMRRIAAPMVGGMISSTVLTLLVIPVIYAWVKQWQHRLD